MQMKSPTSSEWKRGTGLRDDYEIPGACFSLIPRLRNCISFARCDESAISEKLQTTEVRTTCVGGWKLSSTIHKSHRLILI